MGRWASALDWSGSEEGSGVGIRVLQSEVCPRNVPSDGEATPAPSESVAEEEPTLTFVQELVTDRATSRTLARLTALADWMAADDPSSEAAPLVRAFLSDLVRINRTVGTLVFAARARSDGASAESLANAVSLWRAYVVDYVDALALADDGSLDGWASLPEYSAAYVLSVVRPTLDALELGPHGADLGQRLRAVEESFVRIDDTLRTRARPARPLGETVAAPAAW